MPLDTYMREALHRATRMVREEGGARPTFFIASPEGTYTLILESQGVLDADDMAMEVVSAVLRWSMARAFILTCEHTAPSTLAAYVVTAEGAEGVAIAIRKNPLRLGKPTLVEPPSAVQELRTLIPSRVSGLSDAEIENLEEALGVELEDSRPLYIS